MEYTEQQLAEFRSSFARRKRLQFGIAIVFVAILIAFRVFGDQTKGLLEGLPPNAVIATAVAVALGILVFSFRNWRCPACDKYFGRATSIAHCPSCGVALT